ncbi:MAG: hypothetical protein AAF709_07400 [Pseudomonadota bacterium]
MLRDCKKVISRSGVTQSGTWFVELKRIGGVAALTGALAMIAKAVSPPARQTRDEIQDVYDILAPRGVAALLVSQSA